MFNEIEKRILSTFILIPLTFFLIIKGSFLFNILLLFLFFATSFEWYKMSKKKNYHVFGYFFLIFSFYSAYSLRNDFNEKSLLLFLIIIFTCIFTDIGGYIFGKFFKGPKLTKISPNKTYSGMIGGYLLSLFLVKILFNFSYLIYENSIVFNYNTLIIVFLISTVSQIGDIVISYFKRKSKIKDTGNIIPGHGGILDRIDGMIFAFSFSYLIFSYKIII